MIVTRRRRVLRIISALRPLHATSDPSVGGLCYQVHLVLRAAFPGAVAWYDPVRGHVLTEIGGVLYDIDGLCLERPAALELLQRSHKPHRWFQATAHSSLRSS